MWRRLKNAKGDWVEKVYDYVIACNSFKWKISQPLWLKEERRCRKWNEQRLPKVLPGNSGRWLFGRSTKEKGRHGGEADEGGEERRTPGAKS